MRLVFVLVLLMAEMARAQSPEGGGCYTGYDGTDRCVNGDTMDENELMVYTTNIDFTISVLDPLPCITVEFCGDPIGDSDVSCVNLIICGEPIR